MPPRHRVALPSASDALARVPLFARAERAVLDGVAADARVLARAAGGAVVTQGAPADAVFGVVRGRVKISLGHATGWSSTIGVLGPGEVFGELGVLGGAARAARVVALDDVQVVRVPAARFLAALEASPRLSLALTRALAERLRAFGEHVAEIGALDARARVAKKLSFLAQRFGLADRGRVVLDLPLTQQDIAELADLSRQRANIVLRGLVRDGIVAREGRRLVVLDAAALRRLAEASG